MKENIPKNFRVSWSKLGFFVAVMIFSKIFLNPSTIKSILYSKSATGICFSGTYSSTDFGKVTKATISFSA